MKKNIQLLILLLYFLSSCNTGKVMVNRQQMNADVHRLVDNNKNEEKTIKQFLNNLNSNEDYFSRMSFYREILLKDLYHKNLLNSDTVIIIENDMNSSLFPAENYTAFVCSSCNHIIYSYLISENQEFIIKENVNHDGIVAITKNAFSGYVMKKKDSLKNECSKRINYFMFYKIGNRNFFWKENAEFGNRECLN